MKGKVYKTGETKDVGWCLEAVPLKKRQEAELKAAEITMLWFSLGVIRMDMIRNEYIRRTARARRFGDNVRETRLRWFRHVQRRDSEYIGRRMLRPGGRPKTRFMDVRENMKLNGMR